MIVQHIAIKHNLIFISSSMKMIEKKRIALNQGFYINGVDTIAAA